MKTICLAALIAMSAQVLYGQPPVETTKNQTYALPRDSLRAYFGTYQFAPNFSMQIFSSNQRIFAQRIGDTEKFEISPKAPHLFT
jgi:hypothetical protein